AGEGAEPERGRDAGTQLQRRAVLPAPDLVADHAARGEGACAGEAPRPGARRDLRRPLQGPERGSVLQGAAPLLLRRRPAPVRRRVWPLVRHADRAGAARAVSAGPRRVGLTFTRARA